MIYQTRKNKEYIVGLSQKEFNSIKLKTSHTVILPPTVSVL